jgi:hypothetical protein
MDFTKFYSTQIIKASEVIDSVEKTAKTALTYLPEQVRSAAEVVHKASFEFARAQNDAWTAYTESLKQVVVPAAKEAKVKT